MVLVLWALEILNSIHNQLIPFKLVERKRVCVCVCVEINSTLWNILSADIGMTLRRTTKTLLFLQNPQGIHIIVFSRL